MARYYIRPWSQLFMVEYSSYHPPIGNSKRPIHPNEVSLSSPNSCVVCTYSGHVLWYFLHAVYCVCIVQSTKFKADLKSISLSLSLNFFY